MKYSTLGQQYLETSLILDITHQQLLTNRHTPRRTVAALSCRCMENPASSILSLSSFSHDSVKHKILLSRWSDSFNRKLSSLYSNDCTLDYYTEGSVGLPTHRQILTRHPALLPLFLCLFFTRMMGIWAWSREHSISILLYSLKKKSSSSSR